MNQTKTNITKLPSIVLIVCTILMAILFFLPYASSKGTYRESLEKYPDATIGKGIDMTSSDIKDMSLVEYARVYKYAADIGQSEDVAMLCVIMIAILAVFVIMSIILALRKKPIGVIVFDVLSMAMFYILSWDFKDRGVIGNGKYDWGFGYYLFYIVAIGVIGGAIWLLITKRKAKKIETTTTE